MTPCPNCGSTSRKFKIELASKVRITETVHHAMDAFISDARGTVTDPADEIAASVPSLKSIDDLPTEVVAEVLKGHINILEPDENGFWPVEVGAFGNVGRIMVGTLDDAMIEAAAWFQGLAERWREQLQEEK